MYGTASKHILAVFGSTAHTYRLVLATHMKDTKQYMSQIDLKMRNHHAQAKRMHQTVDPDSIDSSPGHQQAMHVSLSSFAKKDARIRGRRFYTGQMNGPRGHRFTPKVTPGSASVNISVGRPQLISSRIHIAQTAHGHLTPCRMIKNVRGQLQNIF